MEPVKGGSLADLPENARAHLDALGSDATPASYALRFAAGLDDVAVVLSGMSDAAQMADNIATMRDPKALTPEERAATEHVVETLREDGGIGCTACRYCVDSCPQQILIPDLFSVYNMKEIFHNWNADYYYNQVYTKQGGKASDCIACGACVDGCPQHLPIPELMVKVADEFEK